jgi:mRNA guanylyltransferase
MYCTSDTNGKELHYLIDRRNDFWYVQGLHFPIPDNELAFHTNTLIDGELVIDTAENKQIQAKYLVFDCLVLDGNSLMNRTLDKRIAYFKERIFDPYRQLYKTYPDEIQYLPFVMELKQMQFAYGIEMMFRQILPNLPHGNDGLIFTCRNTDYKHGTDQHILKWKPEYENSVDFRMELEFPVIQPDEQDRAEGITEPWTDYDSMPLIQLCAHTGNNSGDEWYANMHLEPEEWEKLKSLNQPLDDRIAECYMDERKRWRWMRWRDDKDKPNHISTVESVIESIRDRVTEKELIANAKSIRDEWKKRMAEAAEREKRARSSGPSGQGRTDSMAPSRPDPSATGSNMAPVGVKRKAEEMGGSRPSPGPGGGGFQREGT